MDLIREGKVTPEQVLEDSRKAVIQITDEFDKHLKEIGVELDSANKETRNVMTFVGKCTHCNDGELFIRKGKFGHFIACNKYPDCKTIFSIPQVAVKPAKEMCDVCNHPKVQVTKKRRGPQILCINPKCPEKMEGYTEDQLKEMDAIESGELEK